VLITAPVLLEKKATQFINIQSVSAKTKKKLPIYSIDTNEKKAALTFNAAWGADDTDILLKILEDNGVLASFFFCGTWVDRFPEEARKIAAAGHDIANHGDTHAHVASLNLEQNKKEIQDCHDKIKAVTGIESNFYRPAYGEYNNTVITAAEELNYFTIQWDVDSLDWMARGKEHEINRVLNSKDLKNGSIILFHNDAKDTPITLRPILQGLVDKGFEIVPISELIHREGFSIDHTGRQRLN
jgi:peptidoglycan/xylan/chitin deacetylase (PgdA/CDA1 family)